MNPCNEIRAARRNGSWGARKAERCLFKIRTNRLISKQKGTSTKVWNFLIGSEQRLGTAVLSSRSAARRLPSPCSCAALRGSVTSFNTHERGARFFCCPRNIRVAPAQRSRKTRLQPRRELTRVAVCGPGTYTPAQPCSWFLSSAHQIFKLWFSFIVQEEATLLIKESELW